MALHDLPLFFLGIFFQQYKGKVLCSHTLTNQTNERTEHSIFVNRRFIFITSATQRDKL